jgi:hypothetical protein
MVLKTFDVREGVYRKFLAEEEPEAKREYLEKLEEIRRGKFILVESFAKRYGV